MMSEVYICIVRTDGSVAHYAFQTRMRSPFPPSGSWTLGKDGYLTREASDANIEFDVERLDRSWTRVGDPAVVDWRRLTQEEHALFEQDRDYRNALEDAGGTLRHNIIKARELHRAVLRHKNGDKLMFLDRAWLDCSASADALGAIAVEAKRKMLRDFVNDPRIDTATDVATLKTITPDYDAI